MKPVVVLLHNPGYLNQFDLDFSQLLSSSSSQLKYCFSTVPVCQTSCHRQMIINDMHAPRHEASLVQKQNPTKIGFLSKSYQKLNFSFHKINLFQFSHLMPSQQLRPLETFTPPSQSLNQPGKDNMGCIGASFKFPYLWSWKLCCTEPSSPAGAQRN